MINMWKLIPKTNSVLSDVDYEKELLVSLIFSGKLGSSL